MQETGATAPLLARVLVGRDGELAALRDAWQAAGTTRIVRGPAGIGKSRLVRELGAWAAGRGGTVLSGRASAASATPLRPIREALLGAARRGLRPGEELTPLVPTLAAVVPEWGDGAVPVGESSLLLGEAILRFLASIAGDGTATLVVEDLQWADPETLAVVEYLADNLDGWPVLLVATLRDAEPGDGAELAAALVGRRVAAAVVLAPLGRDAVVSMGRSCLPDENLPAEVVDALVARSEGIPFLVEELIATAVGAGWETVAAAVPGSVVASVEVRLEGLPPEARPLLEAAALLGRSFDWALAARAAGLADETAAYLLRQAVRVQLVDVDGPGFRFHHGLTRDAVLAATPPSDLDLLARRALDDLDAGAGELDGDRCLLAADLAGRAGQPDRAARLLLEAARQALGAGALSSAEVFATRAASFATGERADEAGEVLLRASVLAGHPERATTLGHALLERRTSPAAQAEIHALLGAAALAAGRWDAAGGHAAVAGQLDPALRARAQALTAQAAMGRDDVHEAVRAARGALDAARGSGQAEVQCEALEVLGRAERGRDLAAAHAAFTEAHAVATAAALAPWRVRALQELGTVDMFDTLDLAHLEEARREAERLGALATVAVVDLQLAAAHDERGELDLALAAAQRCEGASRRWHLSTLAMSLCLQGMAHARRGDRPEMDRVHAAAVATGQDPDYVEVSIWGNAVPIADLAAGDLATAAAGLDRAMAVIRRRPATVVPVPGLWALVRTILSEEANGDAARAEVAALAFDMPVSRQMLVAAQAVTLGRSGDAAGATAAFAGADTWLARQHGGFRQSLVRLLAAPSAARDAWGEPVPWLRESLATFESHGLDAFAARCRGELRDLGAPVPRRSQAPTAGAVPPALAGLGITAREVDVLVLVGEGATNREVAARLFISPRTVDKHVERLLLKTGVTRAQLAGIARDAGLLRT